MKLKCIIIDDEPFAQELIKSYLKQLDYIELAGVFGNGIDALQYLNNIKVDLIFLDISMPKLSGLQMLESLPSRPEVIFTTAYSNYAVVSYDLKALDYLVKPITFERFLKAIHKHPKVTSDKIITGNTEEAIFIKTNRQSVKLNLTDIYLIEGMKDYVIFYTSEKKYVVYYSLKKIEQRFPSNFIRIHNSYVVNFDKVTAFSENFLFNQVKNIPVGLKYLEKVKELVARNSL